MCLEKYIKAVKGVIKVIVIKYDKVTLLLYFLIKSNHSTMATLRTEDSGRYGEVVV